MDPVKIPAHFRKLADYFNHVHYENASSNVYKTASV